jgi:hypothetical protein
MYGMPHGKRYAVRNTAYRAVRVILLLLLCLVISACGGARILKEPEPLLEVQPLASQSDQFLEASLQWVIFRSGPGTWAKNADWDEYLLQVKNISGEPVKVINVVVYDSMNVRQRASDSRGALVQQSRNTKKRYKNQGLEVKAGFSGAALAAAGGVAFAGSTAVALTAFQGSSTALAASGAAVVALAAAPVLVAGGIWRGVNNTRVADEIERRHTVFPVGLQPAEQKSLDVFYPLTPSPRRIELNYFNSAGQQVLTIDTSEVLKGLHLVPDDD